MCCPRCPDLVLWALGTVIVAKDYKLKGKKIQVLKEASKLYQTRGGSSDHRTTPKSDTSKAGDGNNDEEDEEDEDDC